MKSKRIWYFIYFIVVFLGSYILGYELFSFLFEDLKPVYITILTVTLTLLISPRLHPTDGKYYRFKWFFFSKPVYI